MRVRPSYWAIYRAALTLIETGKTVTYVTLAATLGVRKQSIWEFMKRHPDVWDFIDEQIEKVNVKYAGLIIRKHAILGMQGSVASAELYFKNQGGFFARLRPGDDPNAPISDDRIIVNHNYLIPRPDYSQLTTGPVVSSTPPPALPPPTAPQPAPVRSKIPVISVRG